MFGDATAGGGEGAALAFGAGTGGGGFDTFGAGTGGGFDTAGGAGGGGFGAATGAGGGVAALGVIARSRSSAARARDAIRFGSLFDDSAARFTQ